MRWSALVIVGVTTLLAACQQTTRREAIADLRPRLSAIRNDLVALVPNLPDAGTVKAARIPEDALELDAQDATRDNTIIIGLAALRDPYDARKDEFVPLVSREDAADFLKEHKGRRILSFEQVTRDLPFRLDDGKF